MTAARCPGGIAATSARRPPRKAAPKPAPATIEPARKAALDPVAAAATIAMIPAARASEPAPAAIHGALRAVRSCASAADAARATIPLPETTALLVLNRCPASSGPSEKKRAPIDQED